MKKKMYLAILCLGLAAVLLLVAFGRNSVPTEIADTYDDFLEAFSSGDYEDIAPYLHYENPEYRQMNLENFHNLQAYQIRSFKKLNDQPDALPPPIPRPCRRLKEPPTII